MSFEPTTIEHLGIKMYSKLPMAISELIANSYDADADVVKVKLYENKDEKKIIVEDDGFGMSFNDVNEYFLRIGRNRRKSGELTTPKGRVVTGKKGLGKLAFFGIGKTIQIETIKENSTEKVKFILDWDELIGTYNKEYEPKFFIDSTDKNKKGTTITLSNLKRKTSFDINSLAKSISNLFIFFNDKFKILITLNDNYQIEVNEKMKYENISVEFEWDYQDLVKALEFEYESKELIKGKIFSSEKPLQPGLRGITLYANGRLVNAPEFFGASESSHAYSYLTGWLEVDYLDNLEEDVISTNRQSLNWDIVKVEQLREYLRHLMLFLERDWRKKRKEKREQDIKQKTDVNITEWFEKVPKPILDRLEPIVTSIVDNSELPVREQTISIKNLHQLIPEYPYFHWRHLHSTIKEAAEKDYKNKDYYRAFIEAMKRYINLVRAKSGSQQSNDSALMSDVFGVSRVLSVTKKYKKPDGMEFSISTKENIEDGQKFLSMGLIRGGRNPVSHEEIQDLRESDLFSEKDCLDALSLLSHLMKRLENAESS